jgi:hypothetical protein
MQNVERNEKEKHIHKDNHGSAHKKKKKKEKKRILKKVYLVLVH